jgi:hypothetical protein
MINPVGANTPGRSHIAWNFGKGPAPAELWPVRFLVGWPLLIPFRHAMWPARGGVCMEGSQGLPGGMGTADAALG